MRIAALSKPAVLAALVALMAGCAKRGDIDSAGQGIIQFRTACPTVAVAAHTGDVTLFDPADSRDARAIDVVATLTDVRPACTTGETDIYSQVGYKVVAVRRDAGPARTVDLPVFAAVVRGATAVTAKRVTMVRLNFAEGALRAEATGSTSAYIDRNAATLPPEIERMITRPRKTGDQDAALDPLARPEVREAIQRSSFELLLGFNLTTDQLRYNVTR
ncbi:MULTISPECIES: hypothetical protein [unclassified Sphingobium]|uniref:hypothetical protein n=1 Tax=unclassified Sphingobium TaxID=2611147 RepID=UPI002224B899|nr:MULTISPECIES: hypothetical protein [unclassified Sphingobium]MCW2351251.1 type IV pilus biogenesis protein CpaD/CtpE [Sphingobium sp. B12D2B]MCW2370471.1 type IV pilus biogenesis protein CpaD/CtpE [Sphingobium sp. B11D3D]MCW2395449.1 type IV pilus biogenesis protein CpaD/CtpE [Sphingobium sp. B8D3B]MCW2418964.1 type IV pilus biogenesis protein CpaD/CtpE [Sphingobium sp. B8D3C]